MICSMSTIYVMKKRLIRKKPAKIQSTLRCENGIVLYSMATSKEETGATSKLRADVCPIISNGKLFPVFQNHRNLHACLPVRRIDCFNSIVIIPHYITPKVPNIPGSIEPCLFWKNLNRTCLRIYRDSSGDLTPLCHPGIPGQHAVYWRGARPVSAERDA